VLPGREIAPGGLPRLKKEIQELSRKIDKLEQLSGEVPEITISFTPISPQGEKGSPVDVFGNSIEEGNVDFQIPEKILPVLISGKRHSLLSGGRSAGKSHAIARFFIGLAIAEGSRFLCVREVQQSLRESVFHLLRTIIESNDLLLRFFHVGATSISGKNGSQFSFIGMQSYTAENIKSYEDFKYCWIEESQNISHRSLELLIPTIRTPGSRLFYNLNPTDETDPVYTEIALSPPTEEDISQTHITYEENFFCPEVIKAEAEKMRNRDIERYRHIYLGEIRKLSASRIFHNFQQGPINIDRVIQQASRMVRGGYQGSIEQRKERQARKIRKIKNSFYFGMDFGFTDPVAISKSFLLEGENKIFILKEYIKEKVQIEALPEIVKNFDPMIREYWPITCDSARPDLIGYLRSFNINTVSCKKNELLDRIDQLSTWDVIISTDCPETYREFSLYSWQEDRNGNILPRPRDKDNHLIDSIFYGLGDGISRVGKVEYAKLKNPYL
jgi:phage terminase large subunit